MKISNIFKISFVKNFSLLAISSLIAQAITVFTTILIARNLQPDGFGKYNIFLVQVGIFGILSAFGFRLTIVNMVAREEHNLNEILNSAILLRIITTLLSIALLFLYNYIFPKEYFTLELSIIASFYLIFIVFSDIIESIAFGQKKMKPTALINIYTTVIFILAVYFLPKSLFTLRTLTILLTLIQFLKAISFLVVGYRYKYLAFSFRNITKYFKLKVTKQIFTNSYPYFFLAIFTLFSNQLSILILEHNSTIEEVGLFNASDKLLNPIKLMISLAFTAIFPNLSYYFKNEIMLFFQIAKSGFEFITIIGSSIAFTFVMYSDIITVMIFGTAYSSTARIIEIQVWFTILYAIFSLIGTIFSASGKQLQLSYLSFFYAVVAIPIYIWGSKYGALGLSKAFLLAAAINMIYHIIYFIKFFDINDNKFKYSIIINFCYFIFVFTMASILKDHLSTSLKSLIVFVFIVLTLILVSHRLNKIKSVR